jgi:hypothetical protein
MEGDTDITEEEGLAATAGGLEEEEGLATMATMEEDITTDTITITEVGGASLRVLPWVACLGKLCTLSHHRSPLSVEEVPLVIPSARARRGGSRSHHITFGVFERF